MLKSFVSEQIGIMVPGNDVMSAIASLFIEVLSYGILIFAIILFLLCYIIDKFTHNVDDYYGGIYSVYQSDTKPITNMTIYYRLLVSIIQNETEAPKVQYPKSFKKWEESFLDICFLAFPTVIIILMLVPTLGFLYNSHFMLYNVLDTSISIDVIGHQWYWSYEYHLGVESNDFMFDSILDVDATVNSLLEVDNRMVIPTELLINLTITSTDVIHSWAVPNLGIKVDAVPGRLATSPLYSYVDGIFYGQCSELCGVLHGFMPICVESVPTDMFFSWALVQSEYLNILELLYTKESNISNS